MNYEIFMQRALELAQQGLGSVSPNPMVGCVIVHEGKIIGEGWHQKYGQEHAEVNAINSLENKTKLSNSTLYVTLEPCTHFGKTPPCSDLIIDSGIPRVVICNTDPNPLMNGKGIEKLRNAKIDVVENILEKKGLQLNKRFFLNQLKKRPYVILKWAESANGHASDSNGSPLAISGDISQIHSHKWRTQEDAILVGSQTVINDNPKLNARNWIGKNPVRVALFPDIDPDYPYNILDDSIKTIIFNNSLNKTKSNIEFIKILKTDNVINEILSNLYKRNIGSLIVEGGPRLHNLFIEAGCFDEIRIFKSKKTIIKEGLPAASIPKNIMEVCNLDLKTDFLRIFSKEFQPY